MDKHIWKAKVQSEHGSMSERTVSAYWDPEHSLTPSSVRDAARIEATMESGKQTGHQTISIELVS